MTPSVTVVIPVLNEEQTVGQTLTDLAAQVYAPCEIIVVDAGSVDATPEIVRSFEGGRVPVRLVDGKPSFPGRGRNIGIGCSNSDWIALTDAGTRIPPDWLGTLVAGLKVEDETVAVAGQYEPVAETFSAECLALAFVPSPTPIDGLPVRGPSTASLLIHRSAWQAAGRFPEHLRACEDLLFFRSLAAAGVRMRAAPGAVVSWSMPDSLGAVFRRFRQYSRHTLRAGLGHTWHRAVGVMYAGGAGLMALALLHNPVWSIGILILAVSRTHRGIRRRAPWLQLRHRITVGTYTQVAAWTFLIDLAMAVGAADHAMDALRGASRPAKSPGPYA